MGVAYFGAGRYREAARWLERGIAEHPSAAWAHRVLCPAYVLDGRRREAERSLATMRVKYPGLTIAQITAAIPFPASLSHRVANGLDSLGVPPG
jgi:adenylate cyclase